VTSPLGQFEREAENLAAVDERLADAAIDLLSTALDAEPGSAAATDAVRIEREVQKARRAVAKAEAILRGLSSRRDD
jgi:hypothetical protein